MAGFLSKYFRLGDGEAPQQAAHRDKFAVWALVNGRVETGPLADPTFYWDESVLARSYHGTYTPEGRSVTVLSPHPFRDLPRPTLSLIHAAFGADVVVNANTEDVGVAEPISREDRRPAPRWVATADGDVGIATRIFERREVYASIVLADFPDEDLPELP